MFSSQVSVAFVYFLFFSGLWFTESDIYIVGSVNTCKNRRTLNYACVRYVRFARVSIVYSLVLRRTQMSHDKKKKNKINKMFKFAPVRNFKAV